MVNTSPSIEYIGSMLVHPVTFEIVKESDFEMFSDWKTTSLIKAESCQEIMTETEVKLTGIMNGSSFEVVQTLEDYFEGKSFFIENTVTEEEIVNEIESTSSAKVFKNKNITKLNKVFINNNQVFSYRVEGEETTIFPCWRFFYNTKVFTTDLQGLFNLTQEKDKEINIEMIWGDICVNVSS